jgi:transposase
MHECGEQISEQVKIIPEKISVIKHKQTKYACRECEATSISSSVVTAPKPAQPIPGSIASQKHLPLWSPPNIAMHCRSIV